MHRLNLSRPAKRFIETLPLKQSKQIAKKLMMLAEDPLPNDHKKLAGQEGYHRVDSGEYRIIYEFDTEVVAVVLIGKRNDDEVYKKLRRMT